MKHSFFQAPVVSISLYGCTTWTLTKRLEKKLDGNYAKMLRAIFNKSWRQHATKHQLYGHLPPITKNIQVRRTRHAGHCWRSRDELISDVLLWTPTSGARGSRISMLAAWHDDDDHNDDIYIYIYTCVCVHMRWDIGSDVIIFMRYWKGCHNFHEILEAMSTYAWRRQWLLLRGCRSDGNLISLIKCIMEFLSWCGCFATTLRTHHLNHVFRYKTYGDKARCSFEQFLERTPPPKKTPDVWLPAYHLTNHRNKDSQYMRSTAGEGRTHKQHCLIGFYKWKYQVCPTSKGIHILALCGH